MLPPKELDELTLEEAINIFVQDDKGAVDEVNNLLSWNGPSIERHLSFISWRLSHTCNFLVFLASRVSAQQSVQSDAVSKYCNCTWPEPQGGYFCVTCNKPRR